MEIRQLQTTRRVSGRGGIDTAKLYCGWSWSVSNASRTHRQLAAPPVPMPLIYKIADRASWEAGVRAGQYVGSAHDVRDGFIHFSTATQSRETAAKHFAEQTDLVLAAIDTTPLGEAVKWEASRGGDLFPHLYAVLPMSAVVWTKPLPLDAQGVHVFPTEMV
jgi:uncharacterized protein (DUF952 family)